MDFHPLKGRWLFIRRTMANAIETFHRKKVVTKFSSYRYDTTGRIVHYGPGGEVLEHDSAFWIIDGKYNQRARSGAAPKKVNRSSK
jgi:hypothetical protein